MRIRVLSVLLLAAGFPASAQTMTAESVLLKVKANFDAVQDYTAMLTGQVNMERLKVPQMKVKLYFKQPNKFKTESKGTSFLPRNIFDINPSDLLSKFDASLMGTDDSAGVPYFKIRLVSKAEKGKPVRESFVWVEGERWTITKLEAYPAEGRKIEVFIESIVIDEKFILPKRISASFDFTQGADSLAERMYAPNRMPRKGSAELIYSDYEVNTGLSDEFFEEKKKE